MKSLAISGCVRNCLNVASWGVGVLLFFFISLALKNDPDMLPLLAARCSMKAHALSPVSKSLREGRSRDQFGYR
ncbi:hypothetical protein ACSN7O_004803, partial [Enterobacter chuandaensis]